MGSKLSVHLVVDALAEQFHVLYEFIEQTPASTHKCLQGSSPQLHFDELLYHKHGSDALQLQIESKISKNNFNMQ